MFEHTVNDDRGHGRIWWIHLPRIPRSVEDAKSLPEGGEVIFICDCEVYRGATTMCRLMNAIYEFNPDKDICVWHNHRRDTMKTRRR